VQYHWISAHEVREIQRISVFPHLKSDEKHRRGLNRFFAWVSGAHPDFRNVRPFVHGQLKQNRSTKFLNTPSSVLQII
jgi:hypothetical protein